MNLAVWSASFGMNFIGVSVRTFKNPTNLNFYISKYLCIFKENKPDN